jgi:hypothetical protein
VSGYWRDISEWLCHAARFVYPQFDLLSPPGLGKRPKSVKGNPSLFIVIPSKVIALLGVKYFLTKEHCIKESPVYDEAY